MKVLITGGNGFLGRAILRRVSRGLLDWEITSYARDETKMEEARRRYPFARYVLGDVRDVQHLALVSIGHDIIIHAAAIKYVDQAELNAGECLSVNLLGSMNVATAARQAGIRRVVGISTDKAVQPVNVYGCSKMAMERLFGEASTLETVFTCARYGNVVGSTGSVVPLFKRQFAESGKVFITDPNMTRFWMSADRAVELIGQALVATPGSVCVPLASAMNMKDVALAAVGECPVEVTGSRPGEKQHEYLIHHAESLRVKRFENHFELLPAGSPDQDSEAFTLASHTPHFRMDPEEMKRLIEDAEGI